MAPAATFVIIGAGLAGAKACEALRERGFDGRIVLLGDERHRPYERPALSKDYLTGKSEREQLFVHPAAWYAEHDVDLRTGHEATAIDRTSRRVTLAGGDQVGYDRLPAHGHPDQRHHHRRRRPGHGSAARRRLG
jgi:3-phenylpropionate/trans-cinnamate dioxygenase ferredoxin reductase component